MSAHHLAHTARLFLSYTRSDDEGIRDDSFVKRLYRDLTAEGFSVWWDRVSMPNRGLTFLQGIRDAIAEVDRVLLIIGPGMVQSEYVRAEWEYALSICKVVIPIVSQGDYGLLPPALRQIDAPDFRIATDYERAFSRLLSQLREPIIPLGSLVNVPQLPRHFVPRQSDLMVIGSLLLADTKQPVVLTAPQRRVGVQGMAGIGKTVLATAVARDCQIRRSFFDGVFWLTLGPTPNLMARQADLCRALGDAPHIFEDVQQGRARLSELLAQRACLIILDNLWEVEHALAFDVLGSRCSLFVTTRDAQLITGLQANSHRLDVLTEEDAITLMSRWILPIDALASSGAQGQSAVSTMVLSPEARAVARECGYLPLALALSAAQVRDGTPWSDVLTALRSADIQFLDHPHGSVMKSLRVSIDALEAEQAKHYAHLAVFPDEQPVPEATILTLWQQVSNMKEYAARRLLTTLGNKALLVLEGQAPDRQVRLHDLQHDYLRMQWNNNLLPLHETLLAAYKGKVTQGWHTGPDDGYFFEHLAYHLREAGRSKELYRLLVDSPDWMEAKFVACVGDISYRADLELAISAFSDPLTQEQLILLMQLYTARQIVALRSSIYSDAELAILTWLGRAPEALSYARIRQGWSAQLSGLVSIYEALQEKGQPSEKLLDEMLEMIRLVEEKDRREELLQRLALIQVQAEHPEEAIALIRELSTGKDTVFLLWNVFEKKRTRALPLLQEALLVTSTMSNEQERNDTQLELVRLLFITDHVEEARFVISQMQDMENQEWAQDQLIRALARNGACKEALAMLPLIKRPLWQADARISLATALAISEKALAMKLLAEAEQQASVVQDEQQQVTLFINIAVAFTKVTGVKQAIAKARSLEYAWSRAHALGQIAAVTLQSDKHEAEALFDEALREAQIVRREEDLHQLWLALQELGKIMAQAGYQQAAIVFNEAAKAALTAEDGRVTLWHSQLVKTLIEVEFYTQAVEIAESMPEGSWQGAWRARSLTDIAEELTRRERFDEALQIVERVRKSGDEGNNILLARVLGNIAIALARSGDKRTEDLLTEIASLRKEDKNIAAQAGVLMELGVLLTERQSTYATSVFNTAYSFVTQQEDLLLSSYLANLVEALARARRFEEAWMVIMNWNLDTSAQDRVNRHLAVAQADIGAYGEAAQTASAIQNQLSRVETACDVALIMAKDGSDQVYNLVSQIGSFAQIIQDNDYRVRALCSVAVCMAHLGDERASSMITQAFESTQTLSENLSREREIARCHVAIAMLQTKDQRGANYLKELEQEASSKYGALRIEMLSALAIGLAQTGATSHARHLFSEAQQCLREMNGGGSSRDILVKSLVEAGQYAEALATFGSYTVDTFLWAIVKWMPSLEQRYQGILLDILCEVIRIIGWMRSDWRGFHKVFTPLKESKGQ